MNALNKIKDFSEEIITYEELKSKASKEFKSYVGLEPSGLVHIGWLPIIDTVKCFLAQNINTTVLLADWHAYLNDKLSSNLEHIRICGTYLSDCFLALDVKPKFMYASELVDSKFYWERVLKIAKTISLLRIKRAMTVLGRSEKNPDFAKLMYPVMQVADIFELDVDVALGGMDQRKAHMLSREVANKFNWKKVTAVHVPLVLSLDENHIGEKMSKSLPQGCIFLHDSENIIKTKIHKAYCPIGICENNPIINICENIIFRYYDKIKIVRDKKYGGDIEVTKLDLLKLYTSKEIHPLDLKQAVSDYISKIILPVRKYFSKHPENFEAMLKIDITR